MRALIIVPLCLMAACSEGGEENKAVAAADAMLAGQWKASSEVTSFRSSDKATPALKAEKGDKSEIAICIGKDETSKPKPELFAGEGYACKYKSSYIRNNRINASLSCTRDALAGEIMMSVEGSYTGDSFEGTVDTVSYLTGEGDFQMNSKIKGERTGDACAPDAGAGAGNAAAAAAGKAGKGGKSGG